MSVPLLLALALLAIIAAVLVAKRNAERDARLRASAERARLTFEDAPGVTPAAAQPKAKRRVRK